MAENFAIKNGVLLLYFGDDQNIVIPDGVTKIEKNAFKGNAHIQTVVMPDSVVEIGTGAFCDCVGLQKIQLSVNLKKIPGSLCKGCKALEEVIVPQGVTRIGSQAFYACESLSSVILPDTLTEISTHVFDSCVSLKTVILPNSVTEIGYGTFTRSGVSDVTLPSTLTKISSELFYSCKNLHSIKMPETVKVIERQAFCGSGLESIVLPDSIRFIEKEAFHDCNFKGSLFEKVKWPKNVTKIGFFVFEHCAWIDTIIVPSHITKIDEGAFLECPNLTKIVIPESVLEIEAKAFGECRSLEEVVIPYNVASISADAFGTTGYYDRLHSGHSFGCKNIKNLTVPCHVFDKGVFRFNWCDRLYAHEGLALIKSERFIHFFEATAQAIQKGIQTLKELGEECLTIYAPSGSIAATYAAENGIEFVETPKNNHLEMICQKDAVDKLESWIRKYKIPTEMLDAVYGTIAKKTDAKNCMELLRTLKAKSNDIFLQ